MIWPLFRYAREGALLLPVRLVHETMHPLIETALEDDGIPKLDAIKFDFTRIQFIDPTGVVVLSNLIDYLRLKGTKVKFRAGKPYSSAIEYLDDLGFFLHYAGKRFREGAALRNSSVPLVRVKSNEIFSYLQHTLMPWIAARVGLDQSSVDGVKVCFEEIFYNIDDHAGVKIGCALAQFFPKNEYIQVAISDFGIGIPNAVRKAIPGLTDADALRKACEEGFTTKSNVRNRGAGLPTLIRYVTLTNHGTVVLVSGKAELAATYDGGIKLRARVARGYYPGTLVKVALRTDKFEAMEADIQSEEFKW